MRLRQRSGCSDRCWRRCGGSSASKTDGGGVGTACADFVQKYCGRLQACEPGLLAIAGFASVADCTAFYLPGCNDAADVAAHRRYACPGAAVRRSAGRDELHRFPAGRPGPPACLPRGGTIPNGGSCSSNWQCATGRCLVSST